MALWQLIYLGTWCSTVTHCWYQWTKKVLNKLRKEYNISGHEGSITHRVLKSHRSKMGTCNHENNVPFRLSPQWFCGNSCLWVHDIQLHIAITNETNVLNKLMKERNVSDDKWEGTLFSWLLHVYYTHLEHLEQIWTFCVSCITYDHLYYAPFMDHYTYNICKAINYFMEKYIYKTYILPRYK